MDGFAKVVNKISAGPTRGTQLEGRLLQPYCNRAGTSRYAADIRTAQKPPKPHKQAGFPDTVVQARVE